MLFEGKVGPQTLADGALGPLRLSRTGSAVFVQGHGRYVEAVLRGRVFSGETAAATGVAPGTSVGTTAAFTLFNPKNSGFHLVVLEAAMGFISGTLGAGTVHYTASLNPAAADVTGTAITVVNNLLGGAAGVGRPLTTATLPATPTIIRPFCSLAAIAAATAVAPYIMRDDVEGEIIIAPGCALSLQATAAAGTSPLVVYSMTWEELAV